MPADLSTYDAVMKDVYGPGIVELIPQQVALLELIENKDAKDYGGRQVTYPSHIGRNSGVGAYAELGALPAAGHQAHVPWSISCKFLAGRVQASAQALELTDGPRNAFKSTMAIEMPGLVNDIRADLNRQLHSDGRGVLALVNGDPGTGTTITVDAPGGVAGAANGTRFIGKGMLVGFVNPATGALRASNRTVTAVAALGTSFTINSAADSTIADNDYVVRVHQSTATDAADSAYAKEVSGLRAHVDDGTYVATYHGISRTTYPQVASPVITVSGAPSADVMQRGADLASELQDGMIEMWMCDSSVRRAIINVADDWRRYAGGDLSNPDIGTKAMKQRDITVGGIPVKKEKYCDYGTLWGLDLSGFSRYTAEPGKWDDTAGTIWQWLGSGSSRQHAFEALYYMWMEVHNDFPRKCVRLDGIQATIAVVNVE